MTGRLQSLIDQRGRLRDCRRCTGTQRSAVVVVPTLSPIIQVGQARGLHEGPAGKPFASTAGKNLSDSDRQTDVDEWEFLRRVYVAAARVMQ